MQAATIGSTVAIGALALSTGPDVSVLAAIQTAATAPATTIQLVMPIDVVELVKVTFAGLATVASAFAAVYALVGARRAKNAETTAKSADAKIDTVSKQIDGLLTARDAAKVKEGEEKAGIAAEVSADQLQKGVAIGIAQERESVAAANPVPAAVATAEIVGAAAPVPVTDKASDRVATATEKLANAAEKTAEKS